MALDRNIFSIPNNERSIDSFKSRLVQGGARPNLFEVLVQRDMVIKQLIQFPELYYAKSHFPLELSQKAFDHLWRMCESYELWCKESKQKHLIILNIID